MNIRKAVIPIAGLGTRLFPASHACKKEFFPVVAPDGIARPLVHYQIIDLLDAGIEEICVIVQPGEEDLLIDYLNGPDDSYLEKLAKYPVLLNEAFKMKAALERIRFAIQDTQAGFGHAVFQSRTFAGGEPVLLCLGDHLFRGGKVSCHTQLLHAFALCGGKSVSAVNRIHGSDLKGYGTIAGERLPDMPSLIRMTRIVEKPSVELARKELRVSGLGEDEYLGWFGMHALAPSIFDVLDEMIRQDLRQKDEFQLTFAQELQRQREGSFALEILDGRRFDFGVPEDFVKSVSEFAVV